MVLSTRESTRIWQKDLVLLDEIRGNVSHVATFYDKMETIRTSQLNVLVEKYKCIGSILLKVESLVVGTGTCSSPSLREYYKYWERRVYNAITQTILKALATLQQLFLLPGAFSSKNAGPICEVKATMNGRDVGLSPNLSDLSKYFRVAWNIETTILFEKTVGIDGEFRLAFCFVV